MVASVASDRFYVLAAWSFVLSGWVSIGVSARRQVIVDLAERVDRWLPLHVCVVEVEADDDDVVEAALRDLPRGELRNSLVEHMCLESAFADGSETAEALEATPSSPSGV